MKKNIYLCILLAIGTIVGINAQDKDSSQDQDCKSDSCRVVVKYAPEKGDFTAQMLFGKGAFLTLPSSGVTGSYPSTIYSVSPSSSSPNSSQSATNMAGVEFRYYAGNKIAIRISGGAILGNSPYVVNIPGVPNADSDHHSDPDTDTNYDYYDGYFGQGDGPLADHYPYSHDSESDGNGFNNHHSHYLIPNYAQIDARENIDLHLSVGAEFLLETNNDRLFPYIGFALPFDYARKSVFTPQTIDSEGNVVLHDTGARHIELTAFGIQAVAGADYYLAKDVFFGFDIKPVSYTYAYSINSPAPELDNLEAENNTISFFAQFSFKVGFKF